MNTVKLYRGDCLDVLKRLDAGSIDAVVTDPPYGITHLKWDQRIPLGPLWEQLRRVVRPRAAVILFGAQPFTSELILSNKEWFKYCWVWKKSTCGGVFNAKKRPVKNHEDIAVFSSGAAANRCRNPMTYHPQGLRPGQRIRNQSNDRDSSFVSSRPSHAPVYRDQASNYPRSVLEISNHNGAFWGKTSEKTTTHPMQKPNALMEYLIRTYSDSGDLILDFAMGSGTTGVACVQTGRDFVGIEISPEYHAIAKRRIARARKSQPVAA